MKRRNITLALALVLFLLLPGCRGRRARIGVIAASDSQYSIELSQTITDTLEETGATVIQKLPDDMSVEAQIDAFGELIDRKVDMILISGVSINSFGEQIQRAKEEGIRVISYDQRLENGELDLQISQFYAWRTAALYLDTIHELLPYGGQFAILGTAAQDENSGIYPGDIRQLLECGKYPGLLYTECAQGMDDLEICCTKVRRLLDTYSNLDVILSLSLTGTRAAMEVLIERGVQSEIRIVGLGNEETQDSCEAAGIETRLFTCDTEAFGAFIAHASLDVLTEAQEFSEGEIFSYNDRQWYIWPGSGFFAEHSFFPVGPTLIWQYKPNLIK